MIPRVATATLGIVLLVMAGLVIGFGYISRPASASVCAIDTSAGNPCGGIPAGFVTTAVVMAALAIVAVLIAAFMKPQQS